LARSGDEHGPDGQIDYIHSRLLTDLERLEEYGAAHPETFDELGNWPAERFEAAWDAFQRRAALTTIEIDRKNMINALYANGMIGGQDLTNEIESIHNMFNQARLTILGFTTDLGGEEEFDSDPALLAKVGHGGT
jgi:hypothetical protein